MSQVLLYSRSKAKSPIAEQTVCLLAEQLQHSGHQVDISHSLNIPRLILNSYQTIHIVLESLTLTANEALHFGLCKALGKNTVISILNSDRNLQKAFLNFVNPDALSVTQTNHFKHYRSIASNKFVLPAFPKADFAAKKTNFKIEALLIPLQTKLEEASQFKTEHCTYFDGRKLLEKNSSLQLRKKWNDLIAHNKISKDSHLILSDNKLKELLDEQAIGVVLADSSLSHTEFTVWLNLTLNRQNLILLNEYQATGFSNYWTSGHNCIVLSAQNWVKQLSYLNFEQNINASIYKQNDLFEPVANELSRLYSKLWQQKTTLLTSRSVKL